TGGEGALHLAAARGNLEIVNFLLEHGADMHQRDHYGCTQLFRAVDWMQNDITQLLLERGADVNTEDTNHNTPLHRAFEKRD
ncbi:ankyrin repeat protein, partial [Schizothecium vesticola]